MMILGIDPGSRITGYGVIDYKHPHAECLTFGCIITSSKRPFYERLKKIYDDITQLIGSFQPEWVVLEDIFYSQNVKSALQLGQARGAALLAAINTNKRISTYAPRVVKQALTGKGSASKEQVRAMVAQMLQLCDQKLELDASDALAVALCHAYRWRINT